MKVVKADRSDILKGKIENNDDDFGMPAGIHWQFKKLSPSEGLDNIIRCILVCHDAVCIHEKVLEKRVMEEDEILPFQPLNEIEEKKKKRNEQKKRF
jgi:hypothetical protein